MSIAAQQKACSENENCEDKLMHIILITSILLAVFILFGIVEYFLHQKRIYSIPIRIHVNGTRGKSSVARLIGAGMRGGGISTLTKVTGTEPYLVLENGIKMPINRKGFANVIEQLGIVKFAINKFPISAFCERLQ